MRPTVISGGWTVQECWEGLKELLDEKDDPRKERELRKVWVDRFVVGNTVLLGPEHLRDLMYERFDGVAGRFLMTSRGLFDAIEVKVIRPGYVIDMGQGKAAVEWWGQIWVFELSDVEEEADKPKPHEIWQAGYVTGWADCERSITVVAGAHKTANPYAQEARR